MHHVNEQLLADESFQPIVSSASLPSYADILRPQSNSQVQHTDTDSDFLYMGSNRKSTEEQKIIYGSIHAVESYPHLLRQISDFEFLKQIYTDSTGSFWKANDLRTGKVCAIKEFHSHIPASSYFREIHTLARSQNRFVVSFLGFTATPPYSLMIELYPNNRLSEQIMNSKMSGTYKTIIALCIAFAMRDIHKNEVIYRDLNPTNLLLDKNRLPKISNFTMSRIQNKRMTKDVGACNYMAPEMMSSENYTNKVDVYSFGMLLYEMAERKIPFHNKSPIEIYNCVVKNNSRPGLKRCSKSVKKMIRKCWRRDPGERPNFDQIFYDIAHGKTFFEGANQKDIVEFAQQIIKEQREQILPKPMCDVSEILRQLRQNLSNQSSLIKRRRSSSTEQFFERPKFNTDISIQVHNIPQLVPNYPQQQQQNNNSLMSTFSSSSLSSISSTDSLNIFLRNAFTALRSGGGPAATYVKNMIIMAEKNPKALETYHKMHLFTILPFNDRNVSDHAFRLLTMMFTVYPGAIDQTYNRIIGFYLTKFPKYAISIFVIYAERIEKTTSPLLLVYFFVSFAQNYLNISEGRDFIRIIRYLLTKYPSFRQMAIQKIRDILCAFIQSRISAVSVEAMRSVCELWDNEFKLPFKSLSRLIIDDELSSYAVSVLLRVSRGFPQTDKNFLHNLILRAAMNPKAFGIVLNFANEDENHARFILENNYSWMNLPKQHLITSFKILLVIIKYPNLRTEISNNKKISLEIGNLLNKVILTRDISIIGIMPFVIKKFEITQIFVDSLSSAGFLMSFASLTKSTNDDQILNAFLILMDFLARKKWVPDFVKFLSFLLLLLNRKNEQAKAAIKIISSLSRFGDIAVHLNSDNIVVYFKSLEQIEDLKKYAQFFLSNIEKIRNE